MLLFALKCLENHEFTIKMKWCPAFETNPIRKNLENVLYSRLLLRISLQYFCFCFFVRPSVKSRVTSLCIVVLWETKEQKIGQRFLSFFSNSPFAHWMTDWLNECGCVMWKPPGEERAFLLLERIFARNHYFFPHVKCTEMKFRREKCMFLGAS